MIKTKIVYNPFLLHSNCIRENGRQKIVKKIVMYFLFV